MNRTIQAGGKALLLTAALAALAACSLGGDVEAWRAKAAGEKNGDGTGYPAPTGLRVTGTTSSSVSLAWNAVTGAYYYAVSYSTSERGQYYDSPGSYTTSTTVSGLNSGVRYYFKVRAVKNYGDEPWSNVVSATTSAALSYTVTLLNNPPYGWQYSDGLEGAYTGTQTHKGDTFTFSYSFKSNVFIDKLQVVLVDCVEPDYVWKTLSGYVPVSENIQPNTEITGSISITATGTATSASFLANRLVIETAAGTSSQPTLTFTSISLVKTTSVVTASGSTLSAQLNWLKNNAASNSSYILTANASETIAPQNLSWNGKNNIMVFLQGDYTDRTISLSTQGAMFTVGSGLTLILDNNITLKGRSDNTASVLVVESGGKLIMNTGTNITGNTPNDSNHGGGVLNSGEFTMNGGTISGNSATHYGGGGVRNFGEFTMNGGTISGNSAGYGGGVRFDSGEFTMNGGTISGNSASGGGGVSVVYRTFTMNGGTISGNIANDDGGGINLLFGTFRMSGGTIYGSSASSTLRNTAGSSGAALYKSSSTAEYGVYSGETFYPSGILNTSEDTIRVQNGNLYNN